VPEDAAEDIDLVSGFEVRQPELLRSGFFVDAAGHRGDHDEAVTGETGTCDRILIDNAYPASIAYTDDTLGLAVVRPEQALAPLGFARIAPTPGRIRGEVAVAGFPFGGALAYASTTFGSISALEGVDGEDWMQRLDLSPPATARPVARSSMRPARSWAWFCRARRVSGCCPTR
jgi:S1-C subfamily serine protease